MEISLKVELEKLMTIVKDYRSKLKGDCPRLRFLRLNLTRSNEASFRRFLRSSIRKCRSDKTDSKDKAMAVACLEVSLVDMSSTTQSKPYSDLAWSNLQSQSSSSISKPKQKTTAASAVMAQANSSASQKASYSQIASDSALPTKSLTNTWKNERSKTSALLATKNATQTE